MQKLELTDQSQEERQFLPLTPDLTSAQVSTTMITILGPNPSSKVQKSSKKSARSSYRPKGQEIANNFLSLNPSPSSPENGCQTSYINPNRAGSSLRVPSRNGRLGKGQHKSPVSTPDHSRASSATRSRAHTPSIINDPAREKGQYHPKEFVDEGNSCRWSIEDHKHQLLVEWMNRGG